MTHTRSRETLTDREVHDLITAAPRAPLLAVAVDARVRVLPRHTNNPYPPRPR
jgi:hypothetical protein